ncbi:ABC transporter ATP-binding protein [Zhihengliuella flava]|uniref:ATP-binding cassette subfamily B protein n=1 Tax=Zhihengliuella flava TaxID=1285193 RepID=A0A931DB42_9MICC|nr:ABC transporter ATP-binding protein [Zhihengliuella flava]MBG6085333.1 ATP-binding cassette subfamily B protein [Zhihengliuella flava]
MSAPSAPARGALRRTLGILRPHVGGQRMLMSGGVTALLLEVAFRVAEPWPVKFVVDAVTASLGAQVEGAAAASIQLLIACGAAVILIVTLRAVSNYLATVAFALAGSRVATKLRQHVFTHVQSLPRSYHFNSRSGDLVQRLVGDVGKLQDVAVTAGLPLLANVITLVAMAGVMLWLDPLLTIIVVLAMVAYGMVSSGSPGEITSAARKTRRGEGQLANIAQESIGAIGVVQAYGLQQELEGRFGSSNQKTLKDGVKAKRLAAGLERRTDVLVGTATAMVLFAGGWRVMQAEMTPGDLVIFLTYLKTAMKPLRDMAKYTGRIARAAASGERVADVLDVVPAIRDAEDARELTHVCGTVELARVRAGYGQSAPVLQDFSLRIPAGQRVALVGPSGSGKSTVSLLVARLLDPDQGQVLMDGHDVRFVTLASLRAHIAYVPQESVLFTGTIRDNIRFGRLEATDAEIEDAARRAQAHDFIMGFEQGYETPVGERGGTLSGGQRQRIAIARAMLRDAAVVILDEATTGLDPDSAAHVLEAFKELTASKTTISITHDAATALSADRVIWIDGGAIWLDGSPQELLRHDAFARWVKQQREDPEHPADPDRLSRPTASHHERRDPVS